MGSCTSSIAARSPSEVAHDLFCSETQLLTSVMDFKQSERSSKEKTKKGHIMGPEGLQVHGVNPEDGVMPCFPTDPHNNYRITKNN